MLTISTLNIPESQNEDKQCFAKTSLTIVFLSIIFAKSFVCMSTYNSRQLDNVDGIWAMLAWAVTSKTWPVGSWQNYFQLWHLALQRFPAAQPKQV